MKLLIKYPTRGRPTLFAKTYSLYKTYLSRKHQVEFRITIDADDASMQSTFISELLSQQVQNTLTKVFVGHSKTKVEAINADMEGAEFDVLLLASDDMIPLVRGYDDIIYTEFQKHYPTYDGALHFNDGNRMDRLCTLSIMGKPLYDGFGYLYHPSYKSLFCDNEYTDAIYAMKKCTYINRCIIRHAWTDATGEDHLHLRNEQFWGEDERNYQSRKIILCSCYCSK